MMMMMFRDLQKKPFTSLRLLILFVIKLCECHLNRFDLFDVTISSIRSRAFLLNYSKKASRHSSGDIISGEMILGTEIDSGQLLSVLFFPFRSPQT